MLDLSANIWYIEFLYALEFIIAGHTNLSRNQGITLDSCLIHIGLDVAEESLAVAPASIGD